MLKNLIIFFLAGLVPALSIANIINLSDDAPKVYTVKKGDTLWDIAGLYFEKPWYWPSLWNNNPNIHDPNLIFPGDRLRLSYKNGNPILIRTKGKSEGQTWPINGAPESVLRQYLTYDTLILKEKLHSVPRVLGSQDGWSYLSTRAPFYVDLPLKDQDWFVYRTGNQFERQFKGKTIQMVSLKKIAKAKLNRTLAEISEMQLIEQTQEVRPNDILLPATGKKTGSIFYPRPAPLGTIGNMVGHLYGSKYVGLRQIVVLDLGLKDGLSAGDTLSAQLPGSSLKGGKGVMRYTKETDTVHEPIVTQLPPHIAGTLLVIHSYPYFSLAMVAESKQPLSAPMKVISVGG